MTTVSSSTSAPPPPPPPASADTASGSSSSASSTPDAGSASTSTASSSNAPGHVDASPAPPPGATLAEMAKHSPPLPGLSQAPPPSLASQVEGTGPRDIDLPLAQMANDAYATPDANGVTGTQSEKELAKAGWTRVQPGDTMTTADGREVTLDAGLLRDDRSGFQAAVYKNDANQYVVAYTGTNGGNDWTKANIPQGFGMQTKQYEQAQMLAKTMVSVHGVDNVAFTGHSLGGGLAQAGILATGGRGVTFNAAGLSNDTMRELGYANPNELRAQYAENGHVRAYQVQGEPLTGVNQVAAPQTLGPELRMKPTESTWNPLTLHGGGGDGQLYVEGVRKGEFWTPSHNPALQVVQAASEPLRSTIGDALELPSKVGGDLADIGRETAGELRDIAAKPDVMLTTRAAGVLADATLDTVGSATQRAADFAGARVTNVTDFAGSVVRTGTRTAGDVVEGAVSLPAAAARSVGLDGTARVIEGAASAAGDAVASGGRMVAKVVEGAGSGVRSVVEGAGSLARTALDKAGDGVQWAADKAADATIAAGVAVKDAAVAAGTAVKDAAVVVGTAVKDAAVATGTAVKDAAIATGTAVKDAAVAMGNAVKDAAVATGNAVKDAGSWAVGKLKGAFGF